MQTASEQISTAFPQSLPKDYEQLEQLIKTRYEKLSKRLQQTARYLLEHAQEVAFATTASLAEQAQVTPSTLVRFANALGFAGFTQMQQLFRQRLVGIHDYSERLQSMRGLSAQSSNMSHLLWSFAEGQRVALERLPHLIEPIQLEQANHLMQSAHAIHVIGCKRSFAVATYLVYALCHVGKRAYLLDGVGNMHLEQAHHISTSDVLIAISFAPYAAKTHQVVIQVGQRNVPIIAITDSTLSPLASCAKVNFVIHEVEVKGFRGLSASMCLAQTLAIGLGVESKASERINQ